MAIRRSRSETVLILSRQTDMMRGPLWRKKDRLSRHVTRLQSKMSVVVVRFARPEFDLITVIKCGIGGCRNYQYG